MTRSFLPWLLYTGTVALLAGCSVQPGTLMQPNSNAGAAPTVVGVANQVNGVAPNREIAVVFSEDMDPNTINAQTFYINGVKGSVSYDATSRIASFKPDNDLQPQTQYSATVTTGVASLAGAHMAQNYVFSFTTRAAQDTSPPQVMSMTPANGATCVDVNTKIVVIFSEGLDPATINNSSFVINGVQGTVTYDAVNIAATFTPSATLQQNMTYTGTLTASIADLAGVALASPVNFSFTTGPCGGGTGGGGANTFVYAGNGTNIAGFKIAADGSATAVPGSPFALAGIYLAPSPTGAFLFGDFFNGSSGTGLTYYTYSVSADGSLSTASSTTQVITDPASSTPPQWLGWIATDRTGASLYSEQGYGGTGSGNQWIGEYAVGTNGSLSPLTAVEARGASPVSFTADDRYGFYGTSGPGAQGLEAVVRNPDGTLSGNRNWQTLLPAGAPNSVGISAIVSPNTSYVAVNFRQVSGTETGIAVYPINGDGSAGTPTAYFPLSGGVAAWDSTGTYLFAGGAGTIYVLRFDSGANTVSLVDTVPLPGASVEAISFLNGHLFAASPTNQSLYVYNFANGVLTPAPGSQLPLGFTPLSIASLQR